MSYDGQFRHQWFEDLQRDTVPMFNCKINCNQLSSNCDMPTGSYLHRGDLEWLFDPHQCTYLGLLSIELFGLELDFHQFDSSTMVHLFSVIKMKIATLRQASNNIARSGFNQQPGWLELRRDLAYFFHYLKAQFANQIMALNRLPNITTLLSSTLDEARKLCLYIGRLSQFGQACTDQSLGSNHELNCYYHLCLDIWWISFELAHLSKSFGTFSYDGQLVRDGNFLMDSFAAQLQQALVVDLIALCSAKFHQGGSADSPSPQPFVCECVKELFIMLRHFVEHSDMHGCFWKQINAILLREGRSTSTDIGSNGKQRQIYLRQFSLFNGLKLPENVDLFVIWLSVGLSKIYFYDSAGHYQPGLSTTILQSTVQDPTKFSNDEAIICAVQALIKADESQHRQQLRATTNQQLISLPLKHSLHYLASSIEYWEPNVDLILPFIEYYLRRLDKMTGRGSGETRGIENPTLLPKSSIDWVRKLEFIRGSSALDYFDILLKVLDITVRKLQSRKNAQSLAQLQHLKGRLYSKIQPSLLNELSSIGLYKFLTFFLVLANAGPELWSELNGKAGTIREIVKCTEIIRYLDHPKTEVMLKFMFAQLRIKPANLICAVMAALIVVIVNKLRAAICAPRCFPNSSHYNNLVKNFSVYLQETRLLAPPASGTYVPNPSTQNESQQPSATDPAAVLNKELNDMLFKLMEELIVADSSTVKKIEHLLRFLFQDMRQISGDSSSWISHSALPLFRRFISTFLGQVANTKLFKALEIAINICPEVIRGTETVFCILTKAIGQLEKRRNVGNDEELRRLLRELVKMTRT